MTHEAGVARRVPRADAGRRGQIPKVNWWQILKRAWADAKADQVPLLAAGVAFFGFLSLFPAVLAGILAYGLIADPQTIRSQADELAATMPSSARDLLLRQVDALASAPQRGLGIGLALALAAALWSASGGVGYMITAITMAYGEDETRGFVRRKGLALILTLGSIAFVLLVASLLAVVALINGDTTVRILLRVAQLILALLMVTVALAILYRLAPNRNAPRIRWVSIGAGVATVIWLLASIGFSVYVETFGNYAKTYGSLASVVVLMLWLWLTVYAILFGAEINAESERRLQSPTVATPRPPEPGRP